MRILLALLAFLVLSDYSCQSSGSTDKHAAIKPTPTESNADNYDANKPLLVPESIIIKTDKIDGVICANLSEWKFRFEDKDLWIPTKEQIFEAEEKIEQYLKDNPNKKSPDLWRKLSKYKRQYVGIVVDGHKRIFCNFFCSEKPLSPSPYLVDDGGDCYFQIEYDLKDKDCYNLLVNGEA